MADQPSSDNRAEEAEASADTHAEEYAAPEPKEASGEGYENRRINERFSIDADVYCVVCNSESGISHPLKVRARDISPGGLCVLSRNMLHVGYTGAVRMIRADGTELIIGIQVTRCRYVGDMMHECGLLFLDAPPEGCAQALARES